jgi:hypothetical protein
LSPTPPGEDPFDRDVPPPGPVEDSQSDWSDDPEPGEDYEVEAVLDHKKQRNGAYKYLIKWKGHNNEHNVWKTAYQMRHAPKLVDKYWAQRRGMPTADDAPPEPRRRGRPRKNPLPNETAKAKTAKTSKNADSAKSLKNAASAENAQSQSKGSPAPGQPMIPDAQTAPAPAPAPRKRGRPPKNATAPATAPARAPVEGQRRSARFARDGLN